MEVKAGQEDAWEAMKDNPRFQVVVLKYVSPNQAFPSVWLQHHVPFETWLSRWM
jgi:hypothetical protein